MKALPKVLLALAGLMFLVMSVAFFVEPARMGSNVSLHAAEPAARIELRAMYGGLELGIGLFLFGCLLRGAVVTGLSLSAMTYGGLGLGRLIGALLEGGASSLHWGLFSAEALAFALSLLGLRLARGSATPD